MPPPPSPFKACAWNAAPENEQRILESPKRLEDTQRALEDGGFCQKRFWALECFVEELAFQENNTCFPLSLKQQRLHGKEVASTFIIHSHLYPCLAT